MTKPSSKSFRPYSTIYPKKENKTYAFTDRKFQPHALAIGQAILASNYLHEMLGEIFFSSATFSFGRAQDVWYSAHFDRPRREMLRAMIVNYDGLTATPEYIARRDHHLQEIAWVLAETEKLEEARNNIVHSPLVFLDALFAEVLERPQGVTPHDLQGNPRATKLSGKDLLIEFRWFRETCMTLGLYARSLSRVSGAGNAPLPNRPKPPTREHQKNRQGQRHRLRAK
jgi:hypothetical protein